MPEIFYQVSRFLLFLWVLNTSGPRLKDCRGDEQGAINTFRGDIPFSSCLSAFIRHPGVFTEGGFFSLSGLLCFLFFVFSGVMRGQRPLIVLLRHSRNLGGNPGVFAFSLVLEP